MSTWIDEAGPNETGRLDELWERIVQEVLRSDAVVLFARSGDALKGAFVEVGIALGAGIPIYVVLDGITLDPANFRPIGSWISHPLVTLCRDSTGAMDAVVRAATEGRKHHLRRVGRNPLPAKAAEMFGRLNYVRGRLPDGQAITQLDIVRSWVAYDLGGNLDGEPPRPELGPGQRAIENAVTAACILADGSPENEALRATMLQSLRRQESLAFCLKAAAAGMSGDDIARRYQELAREGLAP